MWECEAKQSQKRFRGVMKEIHEGQRERQRNTIIKNRKYTWNLGVAR